MWERSVRPVFALVVGVALTFAAGVVALTAPASAASSAQSCSIIAPKGFVKLNPGLTNTAANQTVTIGVPNSTRIFGCKPTSATGGSGLYSATLHTPKLTCSSMFQHAQKFSGVGQITWANKKISKLALTFTTSPSAGNFNVTLGGTVTSGLFKGGKLGGETLVEPLVGKGSCTTMPVTTAIVLKTVKPLSIS